jgi:uncharacterized protein (TIGR00251 family)
MLIKVKVFPASSKQEVIKKSEDSFEVKVISKPERGMANRESLELLSRYFKIPNSNICLIKGAHTHSKILEINLEK